LILSKKEVISIPSSKKKGAATLNKNRVKSCEIKGGSQVNGYDGRLMAKI